MKTLFLAAVLLLSGWQQAEAAGFQWATAPDPDQAGLQVAIWYPSTDKTTDFDVGPFAMRVAVNGAVSGGHHPLIVMSHGTGGMALNSYDTAVALAEAGFVVASVIHTGDKYQDQSSAFTRRDFVDRPRHVSRVIDYVLGAWAGHGSIDPARIGLFCHSDVETTALIIAGGVANMDRVVAFCRTATIDWGCKQARQRGIVWTEAASDPVIGADARVKAVVVAAPALAIAFQPEGLARVKVPVQLWVGARDNIVTDAQLDRGLLPAPPDYHLVQNGGHFAYLSPCSEMLQRSAPMIRDNPPGFDRAKFLRAFHQSMIAFFRTSLR